MRSALSSAVVRYWLGLPVTGSRDVVRRNALGDQEVADRIGTVFRELLVILVASDAVGVSLDLHLQTGIGLQDSGDLGQAELGVGLQSVSASVEEDVGHVDDEAAGRFASGQDAVKLSA